MALYKSLVRRHLEYFTLVWNPYLAEDIQLIERVQRLATKLVQDVGNSWKIAKLEMI